SRRAAARSPRAPPRRGPPATAAGRVVTRLSHLPVLEVHKVCGMSSPHRAALRLVPDPAPGARARTLGAVEVLPGLVRAALMDMSGAVLRRGEAAFAPADAAGDAAGVDAALHA